MDLRLKPSDREFLQSVRSFLDREFPAGWEGFESTDPDEAFAHLRAVNRKLAGKGWLAPSWPESLGGADLDPLKEYLLVDELSYRLIPGLIDGALGGVGVGYAGPTIQRFGTEEQKRAHLIPIARGDTWWCQGFSEPDAGSDLASLQTRAGRDGDDYVINGMKIWTTYGHKADWMILLARTDPESAKHRGLSYFIVEMTNPGITVEPIINMAGLRKFNQVLFDNVRIPSSALLGQEGEGWRQAMTTLDYERRSVASTGSLRRFIEDLIRRAGQMEPSSELRRALAQLTIDVEAARCLELRIVGLAVKSEASSRDASVVRLFTSQLAQRIAETRVRLMGMHGQAHHADAHSRSGIIQSYLTTVGKTIGGGTSEIQRNVIATRGLGLPRG